MIKAGVETLLDLILPRPCPGCGGPEPWCDNCAAVLGTRPRAVRLSEVTLDSAQGMPLPPVWALSHYSGPVRAAILHGKEHGRRDLPARLGTAAGRGISRLIRTARLTGSVWIVPAPSRRSAARRRGGDPVLAMARAAAAELAVGGIPTGVAPCLVTTGRAKDSVGLDAVARTANLAGRVKVVGAGHPPMKAGVLLLDDVVTSGATVLASTAALRANGVEVLGCLAIATAAPWVSRRSFAGSLRPAIRPG